ncbi:MAG TPA: ribosome silencing factor [Methylomusa anaerophila]|uniref:Ribosomal silencing factor RsfS n=1 Tax=Methylomusa anaerophila TaxID=1930071 RepID=A0A348AF84_9FIRM|nr:ribosome silencing factor [Methylomusa anaerophila]BBB89732.1 ribosomal silencing factor RsfS [Methylomusa anaerophila]HML89222.1 ribosome silencing factor [Methylomusa anaerophila]
MNHFKVNELTQDIAQAASDKKARDILIMDLTNISPVTDHFVICSAGSTTQVKAIADHIEEKLAAKGIKPLHKEGYRESHWILLDYGSCVAHIFVEEDRQFYQLERLWNDAKAIVFETTAQDVV